MILTYRGGRTSPGTCVFVGFLLVFVFIFFLGRPYTSSIQTQLPAAKEKISQALGKIHLPGTGSSHSSPAASPIASPVTQHESEPSNTAALKLWTKLQPLLDNHGPHVSKVPGDNGLDFTSFDHENPSTEYTKNIIKISVNNVITMRDGHRAFLQGMKEQFADYKLSDHGVKRGIITTAADSYLPVFLVSLRMLRRTGSTLPVEVWMNTKDEYEPEVCEKILPSMNAHCRILADVIEHDKKYKMGKNIEHFQFKIFAILFSNFQEVLWLDADNFPMVKPDHLFDSEPYKTTGMVIWPDFWYRTISPMYHVINDGKPEHRGIRPAAETGQMLWNKASHLDVLLLSAYYNYYGPGWYYELTCQNGPGQGDKETFIPAAQTLGKPFYQVHTSVKAVGHENAENDGIWIFAMIQADPVQDFYLYSNLSTSHNNSTVPRRPHGFDENKKPQPFFLHCNMPKWNPKDLFKHDSTYDLTWDVHHKPAAAGYTDPPEVAAELNGIERQIWDEVRWVACELEDKLRYFEDDDQVCSRIKHHFETHLDKAPEGTWPPPVPGQHTSSNKSSSDEKDSDDSDEKEIGENDEHLVMSDDGKVTNSPEEKQ